MDMLGTGMILAGIGLIERTKPYAERLGCLPYLAHLDDIIQNGNGAQWQRRIYDRTGNMLDVVRFLVEQSTLSTPTPARRNP